LEGVIEVILFTLHILDPDVLSFRHDLLVGNGMFYLAIRFQTVKGRTPALGDVGSGAVFKWIMVAHVHSSDCRCRCIGKIIARDIRLLASQLYKTGVNRP